MNGIGGVWFVAGGEGDGEAILARMEPALARRGPDDGGGARWQPPVGMVCRTFHTTAEAHRERQPHRGLRGWMVWDGRLDNREELSARLGLDGGASPTDVEIAFAACERWQDDAPGRLAGDFALAYWQPDRLLLARDPAGARPLFYHAAPRCFLWASTLEALLAAADLPRDLDEEWVAGYFTRAMTPGRTPYRAIRCVPPGHVLAVRPGGSAERRYWWPLAPGPVRCGGDGEYADRFEELFRQAVRRRLRTDGAAGADLSGGVDSSSVVCVAHEVLARREAPAAELLPVSFVYDRSETADERRYIRRVEEHLGRRSHHIPQEEFPLFAGWELPLCEMPSVRQCFRARELELVRHLRSRGARIQLRGVGGDHLAWSESPLPFDLADRLAERRLGAFARALARSGRRQGQPYLPLLWQAVRAGLLPRWLRVRVGEPLVGFPAWLRPSFVRRLRLHRRLAGERELAAGAELPSQREHLDQIAHAIDVVAWGYDRGPLAIEVSYPFLDRDLIEFCVGLPFDQFVRDGETRSIHRRALRRVLPAEVAARPGKVSVQEAISRACAERWGELSALFAAPRIAALVDPDRLRESLRRTRYGLGSDPYLLHAVGLEAWLRLQENPRAGAEPAEGPAPAAGVARRA